MTDDGTSTAGPGRWPDFDRAEPPSARSALQRRPWHTLGIFVLGAFSVLLNIGGTLTLARAIDAVVGAGPERSTGWLCLLAAVLYATGGAMWVAQARLTMRLVHGSMRSLRTVAFDLIESTSVLGLRHFGTLDLHGRLTNDVEGVSRALQGSISQFSNSAFLTVALMVTMFLISPLLAVIAVVTVLLGALATRKISGLAVAGYGQEFAATGQLNSALLEWLGADAATRRMLGASGRRDEMARLAEVSARSANRAQRIGGLAQPISLLISYGGYAAVIAVGVWQLRSGSISFGSLQATLLFSRQISGPLVQLANLSNVVQGGMASWQRVAEIHSLGGAGETPSSEPTHRRVGAEPGVVSFRSVSFRYGDGKSAVECLDIDLSCGQTTFLVGETGSGKSTVGSMVAGVYNPTSGELVVPTPHEGSGRAPSVGYVPQDAYLFASECGANILGAQWRQGHERIVQAADDLTVRRLVDVSIDGLAQPTAAVADSLASRQAISLLRCYLSDADIIVLDEATSGLDAATEAAIFDAFRRRFVDRVLIIIAHRTTNVASSDRVIRLSNGRCVVDSIGLRT